MNATHTALQALWRRWVAGENVDIEKEILALLLWNGIRPRQDDGELKQITLSIPTSIEAAYVIGLRYIKKDGSQTEDHFLCRRDTKSGTHPTEIEPHYRNRLEFRVPEYRGTHKQQTMFTRTETPSSDLTQVNTVSYLKRQE